jgi:O-antigen/teichoic acid export membrane protein
MNLHWIKLPSGFKSDLAANFAGVGWSVLLQIACVPLYLRFLGIEAYGLIGFYLVLQTIVQVLDFGLSPTMNREMARYSVQPEKAAESRDFVRTLEAGYWLIGIAAGAVILAVAPLIARDWIKASALSSRTVAHAVMIMGALLVFQWPLSFYQGALMGLGRQVQFNCLKVAMVSLGQGGSVLVLWLFSPTITAFLSWQVVVAGVQVLLIAVLLRRSLPISERAPRFDLSNIRRIWRFAAGMGGITLTGLVLTQADKLLVSKLLSLRVFGYYALAWSVASSLLIIAACVFNVTFPRMSAMVAAGDENGIKQYYHRSSQLMAVVIVPVAAVLSLFSFEILRLWTGNSETAAVTAPILSLLVVGSALNALMSLPYALQLAYGWTSIALRIAIFLSIVFVPAVWFMTTSYGAVGAASVWAGLNGMYVLIGIPLTHSRLLIGETWQWIAEIAVPIVPVLLIAFFCRRLVTISTSAVAGSWMLLLLLFCTVGSAALVSPLIRPRLLTQALRAKMGC